MKLVLNPTTQELDVVYNTASEIQIVDAGQYYTGTEVETALQEIGVITDALATTYLKLDASNDPITGDLQINAELDVSKTYTDTGVDVSAIMLDETITLTSNNGNVHAGMTYELNNANSDNLTSGVGGMIGTTADLNVTGSGTTTVLVGNRSNIKKPSGGGLIGLAVGFQVLFTQGSGSTNNFSALLAQVSGSSPTNTYLLDYTSAFKADDRTLRILDRTAGTVKHIPTSLAATGITYDSADVVLATTTSGDVNIAPIDNVQIDTAAGDIIHSDGTNTINIISSGLAAATVFNEHADNIDLRVESSNFSSILHIDAGNDTVGFGSASASSFVLVAKPSSTISSDTADFQVDPSNSKTVDSTFTDLNLSRFGTARLDIATTKTITNAASVYIEGAPTNVGLGTLTNAYTFWSDDGLNRFDGNVELRSGQILNTTRVTTTYTVLTTDYAVYCDTDGGAFTATLPAGADGQTFKIINVGTSSNNLTLAPNGAELLIGVNSNFTLFDGESLLLTYETTEGWS